MSLALIAVFLKDMRLFFRDRKNLILVILTPVVIMSILGTLAREERQEQYLGNIPLGFCNRDQSFELPYEFELVSPEEQCEARTLEMVEQGELRGALFVPESFSQDIRDGRGSTLTLVLDNSKGSISFTLRTAIESMVNKMNEEVGVAFISAAWEALRDLNVKLKFVVRHLALSRGVIGGIYERAFALNQSLTAIDLVSGIDAVGRVNATVDELTARLVDAKGILALAENVSTVRADLDNATADIIRQTADLGSLQSQIANFSSTYDAFCADCENCSLTSSECESLNASISDLTAAAADYEGTRNQLGYYAALLGNQSNRTADSYRELSLQINSTLGRLTEYNLSPSREDLTLVGALLDEVRRVQDQVRLELVEMDSIILNLTSQIISLEEELTTTSILLDEYTEKEPVNIVRAVSLEPVETFPGGIQLQFLAPNMMLLVLLFITLLVSSMAIVDERRSMTMFRTLLSPLPLALNLLQKLCFIVVLCFVQFFLMFVVVRVLGASYAFDWWLIPALFIISFLFASIGFLVGSIAKSENTALLTSLVLAIPMMFLSGLLFPLEGMTGVMSKVAFWSPLTIGITTLERLLIYHTGPQPLLLFAKIGVAVLLFFLASWTVSKSPSLD